MINFVPLQSTAAAIARGHDFHDWLHEENAKLERQIEAQAEARMSHADRQYLNGEIVQFEYNRRVALIDKLAEDHHTMRAAILATVGYEPAEMRDQRTARRHARAYEQSQGMAVAS